MCANPSGKQCHIAKDLHGRICPIPHPLRIPRLVIDLINAKYKPSFHTNHTTTSHFDVPIAVLYPPRRGNRITRGLYMTNLMPCPVLSRFYLLFYIGQTARTFYYNSWFSRNANDYYSTLMLNVIDGVSLPT